MTIVIGTDHRGVAHKNHIINQCVQYKWIDVGTYDEKRTDYPLYALEALEYMIAGKAEYSVLLCGTGIGMAIAVNRAPFMYAAVVWNEEIARRAKAEDNCNILVLPADFITIEESVAMVNAWMSTPFKGDRYADRLAMID